jgi:predicted Zn-dependent peptidase
MRPASEHMRYELTGGARLLVAPLPGRASASLVLMLAVGSRFEEDRIGGASHFIEHLVFKGTRRRPTAKEIAETIEGVGGVMNAYTDKELTVYWSRVPADRVELAIDLMFDIISDSRLAPEDVERERMVILEELKMYLDQPQDYVHSLFERLIWPNHPLGRDVIGTIESVSATTREDLVEYVRGRYCLPNLVIGLSGAVDVEVAKAMIESHLTLPANSDGRAYLPAPPLPPAPRVMLHRKETEQAHICVGTRGVSYLDPERYALDLLNTILGEGMSSRLFLEIRERRGLAYDVHSYVSKHSDAGLFAVYMGVDPAKAEEAVRAVIDELHRLAEEPLSEAELSKAREFTKGRLRLGLEGTNSLATWLCQQELLTGEVKTVDEVIALYEAVTAESIQHLAGRLLAQPLQMAIIGPFSSDEPFRTIIGA